MECENSHKYPTIGIQLVILKGLIVHINRVTAILFSNKNEFALLVCSFKIFSYFPIDGHK